MPRAKDHSQVSGSSTKADDLGSTGPGSGALSAAGDAAVTRQAADDSTDPLATVRRLLGPEVSDVVFATITPDELLKWGKSISTAALQQAQSALASQLTGTPKGGKVDGLEQYFASTTADFMLTDVKSATAAFLQSAEGAKVAQAISDKLHGSSAVTITSILVAAAYLATAELKVPDISKSLGGGFSVSGSVDVGKLQHLALQSLGAQLSWKGSSVDASVGVTALAGKAAGDELGGKAKATLTSGHIGDASTVEKLQAAVGWKIDDHLSMKLGDTNDLQSGRLIKGTVSATGAWQVSEHAALTATIDDQYGAEHTGIGAKVQFTMNVAHAAGQFGFQGSYDKEKGSFFGVVFRARF